MQHTDTFPTEQNDPIGIIDGMQLEGGGHMRARRASARVSGHKVREGGHSGLGFPLRVRRW